MTSKALKITFAGIVVSSSFKAYSQSMVAGKLIDEEGKPLTNYVLKVFNASKSDSLQIYSSNGFFSFEDRKKCPYRFIVSYFGEQVLDTTVECSKIHKALVLKAKTSTRLKELVIRGKKPIVKHTLMEDQVQVKGISIFENNNVMEILEKIPGLLKTEEQLIYKSLPVAYVRFGKQQMRRAVTPNILQMLEGLYAENTASLTFKRLPDGKSYEIIVNSVPHTGFETTADISGGRGNGNYGNVRSNSLFNIDKTEHRLYLNANQYSTRTSYTSQYTFDDGTVKNINGDNKNRNKSFAIDYANSLKLSKEVNAGVLINYYFYDEPVDCASSVFGQPSRSTSLDIDRYLTAGAYFDLAKKRYQLHIEAAFNRQSGLYKWKDTDNGVQYTKNYSNTPNASVEYSHLIGKKDLKINSLTSYSYMFLSEMDVLSPVQTEDFKEHVYKQDLYLSGSLGKIEFNVGVTADYSHNTNDKNYFFLNPQFSLEYELKGHRFGLAYSQEASRPLSYMLKDTQEQINQGVSSSGNSHLEPEKKTLLELSYQKGNFGLTAGWFRSQGRCTSSPSYKDNQFIYKYVNLGTGNRFVSHFYFSHYWKHFYLSPSGYFEIGRYNVANTNRSLVNRYLSFSVPLGFNWGKHQVSLSFRYTPTSQFQNTKEETSSYLSFAYAVSLWKKALRIQVFANDIFKQNQVRSTLFAEGFKEHKENLTDTRYIGVTLSYRFSSGKETRYINALRNNTTRN